MLSSPPHAGQATDTKSEARAASQSTSAIIAVWFFNFFNARIEQLTVDMDETASELVDVVIKDGRSKRSASTS